jgi:hypothetical protein
MPCTADVAGGKGKLAFELLNLSGIRATVLEPRPLDLKKRIKWLLVSVSRRSVFAHGLEICARARFPDFALVFQAVAGQQKHLLSCSTACPPGSPDCLHLA